MATFYSNSYGGRQMHLDVWQDGGYCKWALYSSGGGNTLYSCYNVCVKVNGTTVYNPGTVAWSANTSKCICLPP